MIATIYDDFAKSALQCPKNAKMILRHSIRGEIPPQDMGLHILLTREGEKMAEHFGKHCHFHIETIFTSTIQRCIQTATLIAKGYKEQTGETITISPTHILADSYIEDVELAQKLFIQDSPYQIMSAFLRNQKLQGMKDLYTTMRILFDFIFQNKESENMEIFITHDTFLIALVCFCHTTLPQENFAWPYMLEGAFLYLKDDNIHCTFRGITKAIPFHF